MVCLALAVGAGFSPLLDRSAAFSAEMSFDSRDVLKAIFADQMLVMGQLLFTYGTKGREYEIGI
jgi:hypothetical protein